MFLTEPAHCTELIRTLLSPVPGPLFQAIVQREVERFELELLFLVFWRDG